MNILYLASDPRIRVKDTTGYGSHIRKTVMAMQENGHHVLILVGGDIRNIWRIKETYGKVKKLNPPFLKVFQKAARDLFEITDDIRSLSFYKNKSKEFKYEIIYERSAPFRRMGQRLSKYSGCPHILEVNDPISEILSFYPSPLKCYAEFMERKSINFATIVVVGSEALRQYYIRKGFPGQKILVIYPTADYSLFDPSRYLKEKGQFTRKPLSIGFIGNMRTWHRVDLLVRAFRKIYIKDKGVRLDLVGDGPELENIRKLVGDLEITDGVIFHGTVPYEKIPNIISNFDICTIPNATWYGSPTKLFEYAAMGKVIVGNRKSPVEEIIRHEENGLLFDALDVSSLEESLIRLVEDDDLRIVLGQRIREKIVTDITWERNIKSILGLVNNLSSSMS